MPKAYSYYSGRKKLLHVHVTTKVKAILITADKTLSSKTVTNNRLQIKTCFNLSLWNLYVKTVNVTFRQTDKLQRGKQIYGTINVLQL